MLRKHVTKLLDVVTFEDGGHVEVGLASLLLDKEFEGTFLTFVKFQRLGVYFILSEKLFVKLLLRA